MPDEKLTDLTIASERKQADVEYLVQGGVDKQIPGSNMGNIKAPLTVATALAVFDDISSLEVGDKITVTGSTGIVIEYFRQDDSSGDLSDFYGFEMGQVDP